MLLAGPGVRVQGGAQRDQPLAPEVVCGARSEIRPQSVQRHRRGSRALALYRTLTDEIGARLTGSPAHMQAARWARDRFAEWGLANPHLEPFEFGRGWQLEHVSVEMTEPRYVPLIAYAEAWSPSTAGVVIGRVVYVGDKTAEQIQATADQLRGAIVLTHLPQSSSSSLAIDRSPVSTNVRWKPAIPLCRWRGPGLRPAS